MTPRWLLALWLLAGCGGPQPQPRGDLKAEAVELTLLYTSDEHGWIEPRLVEGVRYGGVSQLLAMLVTNEEHCAGALPPAPLPSCEQSGTVLLSGGDNYTGPAISGLFHGESMAAALRRLGYAASAFGNHELDFGAPQYDKNRRVAEVPYLGANMAQRSGAATDLVEPFVLVRRRGVTLGIVGVATVTTPLAAAANRFTSIRFEDPGVAIDRVLPRVWEAGADAVVVIAHECHDAMAPIVRAHPDWKVSFVGTGHCHRTSVEVVNGVPVIGPDWRLDHYARVRLRIHPERPAGERAEVLHYELVDVATSSSEPAASVDPEFDGAIARWGAEVDEQLGEVIGYARAGLAKDSQVLGRWVVNSWRQRFEADVAITSEGAIRQELPPGPITVADIFSILPFENELVVCEVPGKALAQMLAHKEAVFAGMRRKDGGFVDARGNPLDPERTYRVVTTDFLFYGGDGFAFQKHDSTPQLTRVNWREPVIAWTREHGSSEKRPLEAVLDDD